jgi:hypothetical protein
VERSWMLLLVGLVACDGPSFGQCYGETDTLSATVDLDGEPVFDWEMGTAYALSVDEVDDRGRTVANQWHVQCGGDNLEDDEEFEETVCIQTPITYGEEVDSPFLDTVNLTRPQGARVREDLPAAARHADGGGRGPPAARRVGRVPHGLAAGPRRQPALRLGVHRRGELRPALSSPMSASSTSVPGPRTRPSRRNQRPPVRPVRPLRGRGLAFGRPVEPSRGAGRRRTGPHQL